MLRIITRVYLSQSQQKAVTVPFFHQHLNSIRKRTYIKIANKRHKNGLPSIVSVCFSWLFESAREKSCIHISHRTGKAPTPRHERFSSFV